MKNNVLYTIVTISTIIILFISILINIFSIHKYFEIKNETTIDTTYNHIVLDSIKYNIIKKDSVIKIYKEEMYEEIKRNDTANTDDVVRTFYQLVAE